MNPPMIILVVVLCVLFFLCLWTMIRLYRWNLTQNPILLAYPVSGGAFATSVVVPGKKPYHMTNEDRTNGLLLTNKNRLLPPLPENIHFSLNIWIRTENQSNDRVVLLQRGDSLVLSYDGNTNSFILTVKVILQPPFLSNTQEFVFTHPSLVMQRWNMITLVFRNRKIDLFVQASLLQSVILLNVPSFPTYDSWILLKNKGGDDVSFYGTITSIRYFNSALTPCDIRRRLFSSSPTISLWNKYFFFPCTFFDKML